MAGELHNCGVYHYGDQAIIRQCCVTSCVEKGQLAKRYAVSRENVYYRQFVAEWNELNNAEMEWVQGRLAELGINEIVGYLV